MPVKDADPRAVELDAAFGAAMGAPPRPREPAAPPEVDHDAPHGRDEAGTPLAPFGHNKDGSVRRSNAGRRASADEKPRTAAAGSEPEPKPGTPKPEPHNYVPALCETGDAAWMILSLGAKVGPDIPLVGRYIPARKLAAQATVFKENQAQLIGAVQYASMHSQAAARWAAKLEQGEITWTLMFGMMVMPFIVQSATLWKLKDGATLGEDGPTVEDLAASNEADLDAFMKALGSQLAEAAKQAGTAAEMTTLVGQLAGEDLVTGGGSNGQHPATA